MSNIHTTTTHEMSENQLESVRDVIKIQLNENVLPYIYKHDLMFTDKNNPIYQEYLSINANANKLLDLYTSFELSDSERNNQITNLITDLYSRTKELIILVDGKQKDYEDNVPLK